MKVRKAKDIQSALTKKGFQLTKSKDHHQYYHLFIAGKKQNVYTYFSHSLKEYDKNLMSELKKQLKFRETEKAELFFDCDMDGPKYLEMLKENKDI